jgi:hypothetical protein
VIKLAKMLTWGIGASFFVEPKNLSKFRTAKIARNILKCLKSRQRGFVGFELTPCAFGVV